MTLPPGVIPLVMAAAVGLLGACAPSGAPAALIPASPSADPIADGIVSSRTWASARIDVVLAFIVDGQATTTRGTGEVGLDDGVGALTWTGGPRLREIVNHRGLFRSGNDGTWTYLGPDGRSATAALVRPLSGLTDLAGAERTGVDSIGGADAVRYDGTVPVTPASVASLGLPEEVAERVLAESRTSDRIRIAAWLDPFRRLVRIDRSLDVRGISAVAMTRLADFGRLLDLEPDGVVTTPR